MLMDSAIYLTYFLAIATTNSVANGLAKQDYRELQTATSQVLGLATLLGALLTSTIFFAGRPLLQWAAGGSSSPDLIQLALHYCQIRSLVAPLSILGMVAQSVCLASLDTATPAIAVAVASLVNVLGDLALVPHFGMVGAAAATAAASSSAALLLLRQTRRTMRSWREDELRKGDGVAEVLKDFPTLGQGEPTPAAPATRRPVPLWSLPDPAAFLSLLWKTGPIFFTIVGKIICYSALSLRATDFGVTAVAAHNVMLRVFFLHATFGDSLSQASQTFMPRVMTRSNSRSALAKLLRRLAVIAAGIGISTKLLGQLVLTKFGSSFTQDASVLSLLMHKNTAQWIGWTLLLHPFAMMLEGCILASQDLVFLLGSYVVTMALHFASLQLSATSFSGVWRALFLFQTFRLTQFSFRTWHQLFRKTDMASSVTVIGGGVAASSGSTIKYLET
jgi:Na+-driven multidrug efflux pump